MSADHNFWRERRAEADSNRSLWLDQTHLSCAKCRPLLFFFIFFFIDLFLSLPAQFAVWSYIGPWFAAWTSWYPWRGHRNLKHVSGDENEAKLASSGFFLDTARQRLRKLTAYFAISRYNITSSWCTHAEPMENSEKSLWTDVRTELCSILYVC